MSEIFQAMFDWSQGLDEDHIDEDHQEIEIGGGNSSRTVLNHICNVRGKRDGVGVVASYQAYFNTSSFTSRYPVYEHNVVELFVADRSSKFEGVARRRGFFDKLLGVIGLRKGLRPINHPLFTEHLVTATEGDDTTDFDNRGYCDALAALVARPGCLRVELQADSGLSALYRMPRQPTAAFFEDALQQSLNVLASRKT